MYLTRSICSRRYRCRPACCTETAENARTVGSRVIPRVTKRWDASSVRQRRVPLAEFTRPRCIARAVNLRIEPRFERSLRRPLTRLTNRVAQFEDRASDLSVIYSQVADVGAIVCILVWYFLRRELMRCASRATNVGNAAKSAERSDLISARTIVINSCLRECCGSAMKMSERRSWPGRHQASAEQR